MIPQRDSGQHITWFARGVAAARRRGWQVEVRDGGARALHELGVPTRRLVRVNLVRHAAVVLGSTQGDDVVDARAAAAAGVEVVRRRSGGGAVFVAPGAQCWVDVVLPRPDPLWVDDVGRSPLWLGSVWADVLGALAGRGNAPVTVHRGGLAGGELARRVCFAGTGPGEVSVDGRKVVGVSQRRTSAAARFQCMVPLRWAPGEWRDLLRLSPTGPPGASVGARAEAEATLDAAALSLSSLSPGTTGWDLVGHLCARLP